MKRASWYAAAVACALASSAAWADVAVPSVSSAELGREISDKGANKALQDLYADQRRWEQVLGQISAGRDTWLDVADRLRSVSDAGASEALDQAVSAALPKNPRGVLKLLDKHFTLEAVCTSQFIEPPSGVEKRFLAEAKRALSRVKTGPLAAKARSCEASLGKVAAE
jgi:hypothetical protein